MKYIIYAKNVDLRIDISGGVLSFKDESSNNDVEVILLPTHMKYLKERAKLIH